MIATPYWVTQQLAIVPRPRGGDWLEDEVVALKNAGVNVLLSLLEADEADELGLASEKEVSSHMGLVFVNFAIPDRSVPSDQTSFKKMLVELEKQIKHLEANATTIQEDYETLMQIMNRARKLALFDEEERSSTTFKMDRNGNLEKMAE